MKLIKWRGVMTLRVGLVTEAAEMLLYAKSSVAKPLPEVVVCVVLMASIDCISVTSNLCWSCQLWLYIKMFSSK